MRVARFAAAVVAAIPVAVATAPPAHSDVVAGGGTATARECSNLHCWAGVLTADVKPIGNSGTALVTWNCQATGTVDPVLTTVSTCSVGGQDAPPVTVPGPYVATAGASVFVIGSEVQGCVGGQSVFAEKVLGDQVVDAGGCSPIRIVTLPL